MVSIDIPDELFNRLSVQADAQGLSIDTWLERQLQPDDDMPDHSLIHKIGEHIPYMVYVFDLCDGRNTYANRYTLTFFGLTWPELREKGSRIFVETLHPEDMGRLVEHRIQWENAADDDVSIKEFRLRRADGQYRWMRSYDAVFKRAEDGTVTHIIGLTVDITSHKREEDTLHTTNILYRTLVENLPGSAVMICDHNLRFVLVDGPEVAISEYKKENLEGQYIYDVLPEPVGKTIEPYIRMALHGETGSDELVWGDACYDIAYAPYYRDFRNQVGYAMIVAHNITDHKRALDALRESEERYRTLFNASLYAVVVCDSESRIHMVNDAAINHFGAPSEQVIGNPLTDYFPGYEELIQQRIQAVLSSGNIIYSEEAIVVADEVHWYWTVTQPLSGDTMSRVQIITYDITERKRAELLEAEHARLAHELEQEQRLTRQRAKLFSIISHEFRTPLAIIQSSTEILFNYLDRLTAEQRENRAANILGQIRHLTDLLDEISKISQVNRDFLAYHPVSNSVRVLCQRIIDEMRNGITEKHTLWLDLAIGDQYAVFDEELMYHALSNLLSNAIKYSPDGGEICLSVRRNHRDWQFSVADQGIGIPVEDQTELFDPFNRAGNVGSIHGTGLGLSIVKEVADYHGGTVVFESQVGVGSKFTITIPDDVPEIES